MKIEKTEYNELRMLIIYALMSGYPITTKIKKVVTLFDIKSLLEESLKNLENENMDENIKEWLNENSLK